MSFPTQKQEIFQGTRTQEGIVSTDIEDFNTRYCAILQLYFVHRFHLRTISCFPVTNFSFSVYEFTQVKPPARNLTIGLAEIKQRGILLFNTYLRLLISIGHLKWSDFFLAWRIAMSICQEEHDKLTEVSHVPPVLVLYLSEFHYISGLNVYVIW